MVSWARMSKIYKDNKFVPWMHETDVEMSYEDELRHYSDWLGIRIELSLRHPTRFLQGYYQLPTFDYYIKNCVLDKGGGYDFTRSRMVNYMDYGSGEYTSGVFYW